MLHRDEDECVAVSFRGLLVARAVTGVPGAMPVQVEAEDFACIQITAKKDGCQIALRPAFYSCA